MALARTVKSLRFGRVFCGLGVFLAIGLVCPVGPAQAKSILLGPAPRRVKSKPVFDPSLPTGALSAPQLATEEPGLRASVQPASSGVRRLGPGDKRVPVLDALSQLEMRLRPIRACARSARTAS